MPSAYQYTPLQTRGVRVLDLLPGSFNDLDICCIIRPTNLDAARKQFEAVSYTWGDPTASKMAIFCNGNNTTLEVSFNCYEVLRYLRKEQDIRTLWIDAICINQSNALECNQQVSMMGELYAAASRTVIFLGTSTPGSETLFQHLEWAEGYEGTSLPPPEQDIRQEMEMIFKRPWFTRIWVIQELKNSRRPIFMCGHRTASFETILSCLYGYSGRFRFIVKFPVPLQLSEPRIEKELFRCVNLGQRMYLLAAMTGLCKSTKPHDRVLALTALITIHQPGIERAIKLTPKGKKLDVLLKSHEDIDKLRRLIDYNQPIEELLKKFANILLHSVGLAILWIIKEPHSKNMPSWVPDLTTDNRDKSRFLGANFPRFWKRYKRTRIDKDFVVKDSDTLLISGERLGSIEHLGPPIHISNEDISSRIRGVQDLLVSLDCARAGGNPDYPDPIVKALKHLTMDDIYTLIRSGSAPGRYIIDEESGSNIALACDNTRIFMAEGDWLGVCPEGAKKGDVVCLIKGALQPCILREIQPNRWAIICGDCLVLEIDQNMVGCHYYGIWQFIEENIEEPAEEFIIC